MEKSSLNNQLRDWNVSPGYQTHQRVGLFNSSFSYSGSLNKKQWPQNKINAASPIKKFHPIHNEGKTKIVSSILDSGCSKLKSIVFQLMDQSATHKINNENLNLNKIREAQVLDLEFQSSLEKDQACQKKTIERLQNQKNLPYTYDYKLSTFQNSKNPNDLLGLLNGPFFFKIFSPLPDKVVRQFSKKKQKIKQVNFVQGYLSSVDLIYYSCQKSLFLHIPNGPNNFSSNGAEKTIKMELPDILYNIHQTHQTYNDLFKFKLADDDSVKGQQHVQEEGQIIIMCHPYFIQLYYLIKNQWKSTNWKVCEEKYNPIHKLDIKFWIPNCSKPREIFLRNHCLFYLPDGQPTKFNKLRLLTGDIQCIDADQVQQKMSLPVENTTISMSPFQKCKSYLSDLSGWAKDIKSLTYLQPFWKAKMHSLQACKHRVLIVCIIERGQGKQNWKTNQKKFARIYLTETINKKEKWKYKNIKSSKPYENILYSKILHCQNNAACSCQALIYIKNNLLSTMQIRVFQKSMASSNLNESTGNINICNIIEQQNILFKQVPYQNFLFPLKLQEQHQPIFQAGKSLIKIENQFFNKYSGGATNLGNTSCIIKDWHLGTNYDQFLYKKDSIITFLTDCGYIRLIQISQIDWIYSVVSDFCELDKNAEDTRCMDKRIVEYLFQKKDEKEKLHCKLAYLGRLIINLMILSTGSFGWKQHIIRYKLSQDSRIISMKVINQIPKKIRKICRYILVGLIEKTKDIMRDSWKKISLINLQSDYLCNSSEEDNKEWKKYFWRFFTIIVNKLSEKQLRHASDFYENESHFISSKDQKVVNLSQSQRNLYLAEIFFQACFSIVFSQIFFQIWDKKIRMISLDFGERLLNILDNMSELCEQMKENKLDIIQIYLKKQISGFCLQYSVQSTRAHSQIRDPVDLIKKDIISQMCQFVVVCQIVKKDFSDLTFSQFCRTTPCTFSSSLFWEFVKQYDQELIKKWEKLIPKFIAVHCPQIQGQNPSIRSQSLHYWLTIVRKICGIKNINKIKLGLSRALKISNIIRESQLSNFPDGTSDHVGTYLVIPQFFSGYLELQRGVKFYELKNFLLSQHSKEKFEAYQEGFSFKIKNQNQSYYKQIETKQFKTESENLIREQSQFSIQNWNSLKIENKQMKEKSEHSGECISMKMPQALTL